MTIKNVMHPEAVHFEWRQQGRVHTYCAIGTGEVFGTVTLSPVGVKPTTYTCTLPGRGEKWTYRGIRNAKIKIEMVIFERALEKSRKVSS